MRESIREAALPKKYVKPMMDMINRFTETIPTPGAVACPAAVAVAIAIVIVLWDRPLNELVLTDEDKAALKFAAGQIRETPEDVRWLIGTELSNVHLKLMEALAL